MRADHLAMGGVIHATSCHHHRCVELTARVSGMPDSTTEINRMRFTARVLIAATATSILATSLRAAPIWYTNETDFLNALVAQGYSAFHEGFEDDTAWGTVRSTIVGGSYTAPSINSQGVTWSSNNPNSGITTGPGPARTGNWGFFELPHGDYGNGVTDGWLGLGDQSMVAIGGWIDGTYGGRIHLILDGNELNPIDFGGGNAVVGPSQFFGVIDSDGFSTFEWRETEGTIGDQKLIFADDFYFAFGGVLVDCNSNGIGDGVDLVSGTSPDCNHNIIPDECEIDVGSSAPGGPFFCVGSCAADCNNNGLLDECEVVVADVYASGQLSPIGVGFPQTFVIAGAPTTRANVLLDFTAYANLGGQTDHISVDVNGVFVGTVFGPTGNDCPETQPDAARLTVPAATFNDAVAGGDAEITMTATAEVFPTECLPATYITVDVTLFVSSDVDTDANGVPDTCDAVPTVSAWGLLVMSLLILVAGTIACTPRTRDV